MRNKILFAGFAAAAALLAGQASANVVLSDTFDNETPPPDQLNWNGDANFNVTSPPSSVDLIGVGGSFDFLPGHGGYVDMDGSSGSGHDPAGQLTSVLSFGPGQYILSFDLAGNQRGAANQTLTVSLGGFSQTLSPLANSPFATVSFAFNTASAGNLIFTENGPSDQQGNLLDNVKLQAVPEPATWAMMLMGFGGLGGVLRANRRKAAVA